jgi:DNA-binding LacI/PurR family transcriptional regulator
MDLFIMIDPAYRDTYWCRQSISGIYEEAARKKHACTILGENPDDHDWDRLFGDSRRLLIVIGTSVSWIPRILQRLHRRGIQVILVSYQPPAGYSGVSAILMDHVDTTRALVHYLLSLGHKRIALYGINPDSSADELKAACFQNMMRDYQLDPDGGWLLYNYASLSDCYDRFVRGRAGISGPQACDAVICANDIVAVSLLRHLNQDGHRVPNELYIVSFGDTLLARLFSTPLTSASLNHAELGRQAVSAFTYLLKNPSVLSVNVKVACKMHIRKSTGHEQPAAFDAFSGTDRETPQVVFYNDDEVQETLAIESFIDRCDELDLQILEGLMTHTTYGELADRLYLAENALKYRIKRMLARLQQDNRQDLLAILSSYLSLQSIRDARALKLDPQSDEAGRFGSGVMQ